MTLKCSILRVVLWLNILSWSSGFHLGKTARLKSANCTTTSFLCNVLLHLVTRPFSLRFGDSTGMRYRCMRRRPLKHVRDFAIGWVCFGVKLRSLDFFAVSNGLSLSARFAISEKRHLHFRDLVISVIHTFLHSEGGRSRLSNQSFLDRFFQQCIRVPLPHSGTPKVDVW